MLNTNDETGRDGLGLRISLPFYAADPSSPNLSFLPRPAMELQVRTRRTMRKISWLLYPAAGALAVMPFQANAQNIEGPPEVKLIDRLHITEPSEYFETSTFQFSVGGPNGLSTSIEGYSVPQAPPQPNDSISGYYPGHILKTNFEGGFSERWSGYYFTWTFSYGNISERFTDQGAPTSTSISQSGGLLVNNNNGTYTYTDRNGAVYTIDSTLVSHQKLPNPWPVTRVVYPNGRTLDIQYQQPPSGSNATRRMTGVQDNLGWFIKYEYNEDTPSSDTSIDWSWIKTSKGGNHAIDICPLAALHCTLTQSKQATNSWNSSAPTSLSIGNAAGNSDVFTLDQYYQVTNYQPANMSTPQTSITYCGRVPVNGFYQCGWTYQGNYYAMPYWSGQGSYTYYGKASSATYQGASVYYTNSTSCQCNQSIVYTTFPGDHFGSSTVSNRSLPWAGNGDYTQGDLFQFGFDDGRSLIFADNPTNRVASYTDRVGAVHNYTYDARGNITQESVTPSGGGAALVTTAVYPATCSNYMTCNKPISITDARNNTSSYTYDPAHGGMLTETKPADANGVTPQKRYSYIQRYAIYLNDSGVLTQASSPIWLLASESHCLTSNWTGTACAAGDADQVVTSYDYGPTSGANNLLLRGLAVTSNGVTHRTCYGYNALGDKVSETAPNANLTSCP